MTRQTNPRPFPGPYSFSYIASALVTLTGIVVVLGWMLDIPALRSLVPGVAAMTPATAISFVLAGASLGMLQMASQDTRRKLAVHRAAMAAAAVVTAIGGLSVLGYVFGRHVGVDQLPFVARLHGGRIGPSTGLNLMLVGVALLLLYVETRGGHRPAQVVVLPAAVATLLVLIGYAYDAHALYGGVSTVPLPLGAALAFAVLSVGILFTHPDRGLMQVLTSASPSGTLARRLLLAATVFLFLLGIVAV
jgi:hypothetical protein